MERREIDSKMTVILRTILKNNSLELSDELTAKDVAGWDSLSHMLIITEIETIFKIKFKLKDLNKMKNVGALVDIVEEKLN
jgi:acyl carrier protein